MAAKARAEQEDLAKRLEELESLLAARRDRASEPPPTGSDPSG
jgi:BMFP domain-containing protein YqiC